jgi:uncharacterized membrane protein YeaQ/YmgE (transglycosylase-associated protein family)
MRRPVLSEPKPERRKHGNARRRPVVESRLSGEAQARILILLAFAVVVLPRLLQTLTQPKYRASVGGDGPPESPLAHHIEQLLTYTLIAWCLWAALQSAGEVRRERRATLVLMLAPWVYIVIRDFYLGHIPHSVQSVYPVVVFAVWRMRPRIDTLGLVGHLTGWTAIISVAIGAFLPAKGVFSQVSGELIAPEKQILPWGVLVGIFTNGNNLGQFLVLGLPAIGFIRRRWVRYVMAGFIVFAIVWTSSRGSLAAIVVGLVGAWVLRALRRDARASASATLVVIAGLVVAILPFTAKTNDAYTNRGYIWRLSLQEWSRDPLFGLGSDWYQAIGKYANLLPSTAFHGHNQVVQTLVVGGIVNLVVVLGMVLVLVVRAARWSRVPVLFPTVYLAMLFVTCTLEVSFGFVDRAFVLAVTVIPVAFIAFAAEPLPAKPVSAPAQPPPGSRLPAPATRARSTAALGASTAGR